jgi:hypothetical protein
MTERLPQSPEEWREHIRKNREKKRQEEAARREAAEKESAKRAWVKDGGSASDFEKAWPEMRDEKRKSRVQKLNDRARDRTQANLRTSF